MNRQEKIEMYFAFLALLIAVANMFIVLLNAPVTFLKPFSISLSLIIFYFAYLKLIEWDVFNKIRMLFLIESIQKEADAEARRIIEDAKQAREN